MSRAFDPRRKFAFATASLRFAMLGKFTAQVHEGVSVFPASKRWAKKCHLWQGHWVHGVLSSLQFVRHAPSQSWLALRAAVLRLAVSSWALPGTAALGSAWS